MKTDKLLTLTLKELNNVNRLLSLEKDVKNREELHPKEVPDSSTFLGKTLRTCKA